MNPLREMKAYIEERMDLFEAMPEQEKALLTEQIFVTVATSPKNYKESVDRYLQRIPAGTKYSHELQGLHETISEWIQPREQMPYHPVRKSKSVCCSIAISDKSKGHMVGRYSFFVDLMLAEGIEYPSQDDVKEYATTWLYEQIDKVIER